MHLAGDCHDNNIRLGDVIRPTADSGCWALLVKNVVTEGENRMLDFLKLECTRKTKVLRRLQTMVALASIVEAMILARG